MSAPAKCNKVDSICPSTHVPTAGCSMCGSICSMHSKQRVNCQRKLPAQVPRSFNSSFSTISLDRVSLPTCLRNVLLPGGCECSRQSALYVPHPCCPDIPPPPPTHTHPPYASCRLPPLPTPSAICHLLDALCPHPLPPCSPAVPMTFSVRLGSAFGNTQLEFYRYADGSSVPNNLENEGGSIQPCSPPEVGCFLIRTVQTSSIAGFRVTASPSPRVSPSTSPTPSSDGGV